MFNFSQKVWLELSEIPKGRVTTYKEIARAVGRPRACRGVGQAVKRNPDAPIVPCHRVVCSDGKIGGYNGGVPKKIALLKAEGVKVENGKIKDFDKKLYKF